jgi:hypothetical protein
VRVAARSLARGALHGYTRSGVLQRRQGRAREHDGLAPLGPHDR